MRRYSRQSGYLFVLADVALDDQDDDDDDDE
jgi:hypothetical protein